MRTTSTKTANDLSKRTIEVMEGMLAGKIEPKLAKEFYNGLGKVVSIHRVRVAAHENNKVKIDLTFFK